MSVIVMGMEMPDNFGECRLMVDYWCYAKPVNGQPGPTFMEKRPDWCPLRLLPEKHGRLIDLDALLDRINGEERPEMYDGMDEVFWIQKCLEEATAIVEAEGEEMEERK